jgi:hypothetical protein
MSQSFQKHFNLNQLNGKEILSFLLSLGGDFLDALIQRRLNQGDNLEDGLVYIIQKDDELHFHPGNDCEADLNLHLMTIGYCAQILHNAKSMTSKNAESYIQNFIDTTEVLTINSYLNMQ